MKTIKSLLILSTLLILTLASCNKDSQPPIISQLTVDGVGLADAADARYEGQHGLGSTIEFKVDATDDTELTLFQVTNQTSNSLLLDEGTLDGTADNFSYSFAVDSVTYATSDSIALLFLVQDGNGSSDDALYIIRL